MPNFTIIVFSLLLSNYFGENFISNSLGFEDQEN